MTAPALVSVNLLATVEQASTGPDPYRVDTDGAPYVPVGDGGIVLGVRLGDGVWDHLGDHAAPGADKASDAPNHTSKTEPAHP
jgi:hypothetical protein